RRGSSSLRRPLPTPLRPDPDAVNEDAMRSLSRAAVCVGVNGLDVSTLPADYARWTWPNDRDLPLLLRAAVAPASTANPPTLTVASQALLTALTEQSAAAAVLKSGLSLEFGNNAAIQVPSLNIGGATFVPEGSAIPLSEGTATGVWLEPRKLAV